MTKKDAIEKVAKLLKLAEGNPSSHEAATAKAQADKLIKEHHLDKSDLSANKMTAAFDDLVDALQNYVANHPGIPDGIMGAASTMAVVKDTISRIKNIGEGDKAAHLKKFATVVYTSALFFGSNSTVSAIKSILDATLKTHGLTL
jgi:ElaB/YqjD/DUF883 family membrane-anchored ribosome-binding protein